MDRPGHQQDVSSKTTAAKHEGGHRADKYNTNVKWRFSPQLTTGTDDANQWAFEGHFLRLPVDVGHVIEQAGEEPR